MRDVTGEVPIRRMSVARARLEGVPSDARADIGACEAAALLAIKRADTLLPEAHPFQLGHAELDFRPDEGILEVTVTVQGYAREHLDNQAMLGAVVALLTARQQMGVESIRLAEVGLVQNVVA